MQLAETESFGLMRIDLKPAAGVIEVIGPGKISGPVLDAHNRAFLARLTDRRYSLRNDKRPHLATGLRRISQLLPCLALARSDGRQFVERVTGAPWPDRRSAYDGIQGWLTPVHADLEAGGWRMRLNASRAVSSAVGRLCRYLSVVAMLACPSRSFTTCRSAPPWRSHEAWA